MTKRIVSITYRIDYKRWSHNQWSSECVNTYISAKEWREYYNECEQSAKITKVCVRYNDGSHEALECRRNHTMRG